MNSFKQIKNEKIDKDNAINIYIHNSGLEIVFLKNSDKNRVFLPCFKTLAENNKGIAHIVEHCVLCGSEKYPIKDPFNELTKGTLNTYLNAITYRDKTIYPVASRVLGEFDKLFRVYIDGVFAPLLKEEVFMLEGIRKDAKEKKYNGIVYNEMLSAYNDGEFRLMESVFQGLFPDTSTRFNSAGNPSEIEDLTYTEFLDYYEKYYSKSNCILYFYGDIDIDEYLDYIEDNYLQEYVKNEKIDFTIQEPIVSSIRKEDLLLNDINYYGIAYVINKNRDLYLGYEFNIIMDYMLSDNSSPLQKFLIDKYDFEDISYDMETQLFQNIFTIILKNKTNVNIEKVKNDINKFIEKHLKEGINFEGLESQINSFIFSAIEEEYGYKTKGIGYFLHLIEFWLYGDSRNVDMLPINLDFEKIRSEIKSGKVEEILIGEIVNSKHNCTVELLASQQKQNINNREIIINKTDYEKNKLLEDYLAIDDLKKANELIKTIEIENIPPKDTLDFTVENIGQNPVIIVEPTKEKISYYTINIEVGDVDFNILGLYIELFGQLSTEKTLIEKLNLDIDNYIGDFQISFDSFIKEEKIHYYIILEIKVLNEFLKKSLEIAMEILTETAYTEINLIRRKINDTYNEINEVIENDNSELGIVRCFSNFTYDNKVIDQVEGIDFFYFIEKVKKYDDHKLKKLMEKLKDMKDYIATKSNITFSVSTTKIQEFKQIITNLDLKKNIIVTKDLIELEKTLKKQKKESIKIRGNNNTNIMCGEIYGSEHTGNWKVIANIIKNDYLNREIRIKGGAYSYGFEVLRNNRFFVYSINDPNVENTIKIFEEIVDYIKRLTMSENELKKNIVGTLGEIYTVKSDYDLYFSTVSKYLRGIFNEEDEKKINEIKKFSINELEKDSYNMFSNLQNISILIIGP